LFHLHSRVLHVLLILLRVLINWIVLAIWDITMWVANVFQLSVQLTNYWVEVNVFVKLSMPIKAMFVPNVPVTQNQVQTNQYALANIRMITLIKLNGYVLHVLPTLLPVLIKQTAYAILDIILLLQSVFQSVKLTKCTREVVAFVTVGTI
jgi:hypothetical protein